VQRLVAELHLCEVVSAALVESSADEGLMVGEVGKASPRISGRWEFYSLSPRGFEELVFDLLASVGFVNLDWYRRTPKNSSPSDRRRDN
jgi:hypothetical protein